MKKIKIIIFCLLLLSSAIIFSKEKNTSSASIQIVLKLPKQDKNISATSNLHLSSIPYTPPINIPQNFEVVDIRIDNGLYFKIKSTSNENKKINISVNIIDRKYKTITKRDYPIELKDEKTYSIKLKNEIFKSLEGKTVFAVISDENGNACSYGFNQ